jgi:CRP-like cAMP-binding protein
MNFDQVLNSPIFKGFNSDELPIFMSGYNFQVKRYQKDDVFNMMGNECSSVNILIEGSVRGEMTDFSGKTIKIEDIHAPNTIASAFLFGKKRKYPVSVIANELTDIMVIYREEFVKMMQANQIILNNYLNLVSSKAQFLSEKIRFLSLKNLRQKIAYYLFNLPSDDNNVVNLPVSHEQMAELFGVARPSLGREFIKMEQEGAIKKTGRRTVKIIDQSLLLDELD